MNDFDTLLSRYLDGVMDAEDLVRLESFLATSEESRREFILACAQEVALRDLIKSSQQQEAADQAIRDGRSVTRQLMAIPGHRRFPVLKAISMAAGLLSAAMLWMVLGQTGPTTSIVQVRAIAGDVVVVDVHGRNAAVDGQSILAGQGLETVGAKSSAVVRYEDGTQVELQGSTALTFFASTGKRIQLDYGALTAEVSRQPAGAAMVLATAQAEAEVVGTQLSLSANDGVTRLAVTDGRVRFSRTADGSSVMVDAGFAATASASIPLEVQPLTVTQGPVGHWTFDEVRNMQAPDSSGNHNDGIIVGSPTPTLYTRRCLSFDGDDGVNVADSPSLDPDGAFTVSAWINNRQPDGNRDSADYFNIASKGWVPHPGGSWSLLWNSKDIRSEPNVCFFVRRSDDSDYQWIAFPYREKNVWTHVAAVFDGASLCLYQDGILKSGPEPLGSDVIRTNDLDLSLGGKPVSVGGGHPWNGLLDDIRIYDRALSAAEIQVLFEKF